MRRSAAASVGLNAVASLAPQVLGLTMLTARDFGQFSVVYLTFGFATSVLFSVLCDAWVVQSNSSRGWSDFCSVLLLICLPFSILSMIISICVAQGQSIWYLALFAVFVNVYRIGLRYYLVHTRAWTNVVLCDLLAMLGIAGGFVLCWSLGWSALNAVFVGWGLGGLLSISAGHFPTIRVRRSISWIAENRVAIRPLLADSLVMDAAAVGTPYVLLPSLGLSGFGIYRAISNVSAPVRLMLTPFRALIIGSPGSSLSNRMTAVVLGAGLVCGSSAVVLLRVLGASALDLGVLSELSVYAVPCGIYVFSTMLLSYYPLVCRALKLSRILLVGRSVQTVLGVVFPILGYIVGGLWGAVWAFAFSSLTSGFVWLVLAWSSVRRSC